MRAIATMTKTEARRLVDRIRGQAKDLCRSLSELRDQNGWLSLGYATWAACCETEFGYSKQHANRLIQADGIRRQLSSECETGQEDRQEVEPIGSTSLPESQARELARVPAEQRQAVLDWAAEKAGDKPLTAAAIRHAADEVLEVEPEGEEAPTHPSPLDFSAVLIKRFDIVLCQTMKEFGDKASFAVAAAAVENFAIKVRGRA